MSLDELTHEEVATFYVFHLRMVLGVVGHIDGRFAVDVQIRRRIVFQVELASEPSEVDSFGGGVRRGHDLGFTRGEGDTLLLLGGPREWRPD